MLQDGEIAQMTKMQYIKSLQKEKKGVSSDVKHRYITNSVIHIQPLATTTSGEIWINETISRGETIIIKHQSKLYLGRVLNFRIHNQVNKADRSFYKDIVKCASPGQIDNLAVLLDPIFKIQNFKKIEIKNFKYYICLKDYKFHTIEDVNLSKPENKNLINSAIRRN